MTAVLTVDSKVLIQMRLENFRRNRETCPADHRAGFDRLIAMAEAELHDAERAPASGTTWAAA